MDNLQRQIDHLRTEAREDFKFMMLALATAKENMDKVSQDLGRVHGRMGRQEERFELMLDVVQQTVNGVGTKAELEEIRSRLETLEKKIA